jgi:hypothetical protein
VNVKEIGSSRLKSLAAEALLLSPPSPAQCPSRPVRSLPATMEDLAGLSFTATSSSSSTAPKPAPANQTGFPPPPQMPTYHSPVPSRTIPPNYYTALGSNGAPKHTTSATSKLRVKPDSFASLSSFAGISSAQTGESTSLEAQRLARERERREAADVERRKLDLHFGADEFWERQSRANTPKIIATSET